VLASVSYPRPEPDDARRWTDQIDGDDAEARERLLDRVRYGLYPPGSTFKVLVAGAALRASPTNQTATAACIRLPDGRVGNYVRGVPRPVRDDPMDTVPHGTVDLRRGLIVSCNAYFAQLAVTLGPGPLLEAASLFQIDLARTSAAPGMQPSLAQAGYGQGQVIVSPLKMARVISAVAARGVVPTVSWMRSLPKEGAGKERFLSRADAVVLSQYLREAVTAGTGRMLATNATAIAGKTGTAEVQNGRAHSWFAGFAPFDSVRHRIAFAVLVEHAGYGGKTAAPVAGEIVAAARSIGWFKGPHQTDQ
jgi:peptidoglycan glycosyltransferase